jgi:hypothetical protein
VASHADQDPEFQQQEGWSLIYHARCDEDCASDGSTWEGEVLFDLRRVPLLDPPYAAGCAPFPWARQSWQHVALALAGGEPVVAHAGLLSWACSFEVDDYYDWETQEWISEWDGELYSQYGGFVITPSR